MRAMQRILAGLLALLMVLGAASPGWTGSSIPPPPTDSPAPADPEASAAAQHADPQGKGVPERGGGQERSGPAPRGSR